MSVYIKGMDMPDNCYNNCPFFTQIQPGIDHGLINYCRLENWKKPITPLAFSVYEAKQGRQPFCPLVPVPEHGRLIDADALAEMLEKYKTEYALKAKEDIVHLHKAWGLYEAELMAESLPTIIPADKEGEG